MYKNGKIYKLVSDLTDNIYIGATCNPLYKRLSQHKTARNSTRSKEIVKFGDCKIILIEDFPCERKEQLNARERYWIEQNKHICVNFGLPTRTVKEWKEQNKDRITEAFKKWKEQNKDKMTYYTRKITCECGCEICNQNISRHYKSIKHIKWIEQNKNNETNTTS